MSKTRLTLESFLKSYPVVSRLKVKWGDMDAFQHVNNAVYFKYVESNRLKYFAEIAKAIHSVDPLGQRVSISYSY